MTTFDDRKNSAEAKFAHDEEMRFKATSRRNRMFGVWAAAQLGLSGVEADDYASQVVRADFAIPGDSDVIGKVAADFKAAGVAFGEGDLRAKLAAYLSEAIATIEAGR